MVLGSLSAEEVLGVRCSSKEIRGSYSFGNTVYEAVKELRISCCVNRRRFFSVD